MHDLGHPWADRDETLGIHRVHPKIMQRHIFDFRFRPQTGSRTVFQKPEVEMSEPEVENMLYRKRTKLYNVSVILLF